MPLEYWGHMVRSISRGYATDRSTKGSPARLFHAISQGAKFFNKAHPVPAGSSISRDSHMRNARCMITCDQLWDSLSSGSLVE